MSFYDEDNSSSERDFLERSITAFTGFERIFQEMIERTTRRIEEVKRLQKEIYGVDVTDFETATQKVAEQLEKGENRFVDWARLLIEGMMLEYGRAGMKKDLLKVRDMLRTMRHIRNSSEGGD